MDEHTQETSAQDNFQEFMDCYLGNQTGADHEDAEGARTTTPADEPAAEDIPGGEDAGSQEDGERGSGQGEETFEIKVNKETRTVTKSELLTLAQKGADYDRVKQRAHEVDGLQAENRELKKFKTDNQLVIDTVSRLAEQSGTSVPDFMKTLRVNLLKASGMSEDAASERVGREDAEMEASRLRRSSPPPQDDAQSRAAKDIADFKRLYPDVSLTRDQIAELTPYFESGLTLAEAYQKSQLEAMTQKVSALQARLDAAEKNSANRAKSPGSVRDSGSKTRTQFDDFWEAYK